MHLTIIEYKVSIFFSTEAVTRKCSVKLTGRHVYWSLLFNKAAGLGVAILLRKRF